MRALLIPALVIALAAPYGGTLARAEQPEGEQPPSSTASIADTPAGWRAFVTSFSVDEAGRQALAELAGEMTSCVAFYNLFKAVAVKSGQKIDLQRISVAQMLLLARTAIITDRDTALARSNGALAEIQAELEEAPEAGKVNTFLAKWGNHCGLVLAQPVELAEALRRRDEKENREEETAE